MKGALFDGVDALIDSAPELADLRAHGLHLLAARRWRELGRQVPRELLDDEIFAAFLVLTAPAVVKQVREAWTGPIVLLKGPVVAARYPDPGLRPYRDLDLLVGDAPAAQEALLAAGFVAVGDRDEAHHLRKLRSPNLPLTVEVHSRPKWIAGLAPPPLEEILAAAVDAPIGIDGVLAPAAHHDAMLLTGHLWAHDPLTQLLRVVDVAVTAEASDRRELDALARAWGIGRPWRTTMAVVDSLLLGVGSHPWALRLWARSMRSGREPRVFEAHLNRAVSPFWSSAPRRAFGALVRSLFSLLTPMPGESWRSKVVRVRNQLANPSMRRSEHLESLDAGDE
jgi:Uncharacterised nucleotidyltransferase